MNRSLLTIFLSLSCIFAAAQTTPQELYIQKWAPVAVKEMYRSGVPASITLAQGLLESRYGLSPLASEGNNHFGIKCHDWTGKTMYFDDDEKGECFRVYDSAEESFCDHSDFLRYRDRYKFLFENKTTDYKAWAYGLKKAGYATDPGYADKLIKNIEDYKLYEYDKMTVAEAETVSEDSGAVVSKVPAKPSGKRGLFRKRHRKSSAEVAAVPDQIPSSPLSIEEPKKVDKSRLEEFNFSLTREAYSKNGVPFISSVEGETYSSIASSYHLYLREILRFNDLKADQELLPGTVVYLQAKKKQTEKGLDKYIADGSESLWDISQRFGVKMSSIVKRNRLAPGYEPREGDTILLRGRKLKNNKG